MKYNLSKTEQQYDNLTYDGSSIGEVRFSKKRRRSVYLVGAGLLVVAVVLALGLGIGLGTRSEGSSSATGNQDAQKGTGYTTVTTTIATSGNIQTSTPQTTPKSETQTTHTQPAKTSTTLHPTTTEYVDWLSKPCTSQETPPSCPWNSSDNPLLLVSLDGFKAEYILRNLTPVIQKLRSCGVHTPYMRAAYPTLTFPNHYTIVTGLYPESHGIVGNSMYDPGLNESFRIGSSTSYYPHWWGGEPLWITAKRQRKKTAAYFWVGSDVNISGIYPDIWNKYNGKVPYEERVDTVIGWLLMNKAERPDFMTLYFNEPDHQGHGTGPDSPEVNEMLQKVDNIIKRLMNGLLRHQLDHCVNLIILADHGMAPTSCERQVDLNMYIHGVDKMLIYDGTTGHINPHFYKHGSAVVKNDNPMSTEDIIKHLQCKNSHLNVFTRDTIPKRHHYTNTDRIGDVIMDIESSWLVYDKKSSFCLDGNHGYDNIYKSMHALFLAHGPDFKQGLEVNPFENIELYNLMSELLHITPAPNNGTAGALNHLLRASKDLPDVTNITSYPVCDSVNRGRNSTCACSHMADTVPRINRTTIHFPSGAPVLDVNRNACLLPAHQFTTIFDHAYKMPGLTSYILMSDRVSSYQPDNDTCITPDPRLSALDNPDCSEYENIETGIVMARFYEAGFAQNETEKSEAFFSSNMVPMYKGFREGIWTYLWRVIKEYATIDKQVSVTMGPAFDYNVDGLCETPNNLTRYVSNTSAVPLPTHFFVILMKCQNNSTTLNACSEDDLDILSFVLPHQPKTHNCIPDKDFLLNNVARIKDIEELTGFRFMTRFNTDAGARLRTFLPTALWKAPVVTSWTELPCTLTTDHCPPGRPPVLLISLDGFRADYLKRHLTPTIERLSKCGVHTPYMRSVFPTVTFPNHYSIVTGLYPESHGIVYNTMFDEKIGHIFSISKSISKDPRWWKGEPIWITAKKQGLKTATYFWPGSDVNITGIYPDIWKHYDGTAGYTERVYEVLSWLDMPKESRPDFMTLYFDQPDHAGHSFGPESDGVNGQLQTVDELIDILMTNLYEKNLQNCINIIILADHGFDDISCGKTVKVSDYYQNITQMLMLERVFGQVFPQFMKVSSSTAVKNAQEFSSQEIVNALNCKHPAMHVFTKDTLPKRHHYTNNDRIAPVLLDMETEWMVFDDHIFYCNGGNHGWDNTYRSMHALFLAHGPSFKQNYATEPFENIELYNMMSELLGIVPAPNNGTEGSLTHILLNPKPLTIDIEAIELCNSSEDDAAPVCGCANKNVSNIKVSNDNSSSVVNKTLIFGVPLVKNDSACILTDEHSAWGYSSLFHAPVWLSTFTDNATMQEQSTEPCIVSYPRTNVQIMNCSASINGNFTLQSLLLNGMSSRHDGVALSSTVIPMYKGFQKGIWQFVSELIRDYVSIYGTLSITTGVIYDYNNDGLWEGIRNETRFANGNSDIPVPSDIYIILAKCKTTAEQLPCRGDVDVMSFILPHLQEAPNCLSYKDYLRDNVARIRDIELLTGLQFMTFQSNKSARLRTFLPEELWESTLFKSWSETPCNQQEQCNSDYRPLLLLSLSGFRADYLLHNFTPNLKRLSECGVNTPYMRAVYPTKTFPNHYTIVTGLYPETHGIIDDSFYDVNVRRTFYSNNIDSVKDSRWWDTAEPLWVRAKRQGLKTAASFWPGSYANISGIYPDIWKDFDQSGSYLSQVNEILSWLSLPEAERPDFVVAYMNEPDKTGRNVGPSNKDGIGAALLQVDDAVGKLMAGLYEKGLHGCVNIVIVSDHGMADVSCHRLQRLKYYVDLNYLSSNFYVWDGAVGRISNTYKYNSTVRGIIPNPDRISLDGIMKNISCRSTHLRPYYKSQLPVRLHYSDNDRIDDVILDMDTEWLATRSYIADCRGGDSGWDNTDQNMQALFLAYGPAFKQNLTVEPFENIELYNMFSTILNTTSAPNNGTFGSLNNLLKNPPNIPLANSSTDYKDAHIAISSVTDLARFMEESNCSSGCPHFTDSKLAEILKDLNTTAEFQHTPWGLPGLKHDSFQNSTVNVLYQPRFTTAFDTINMLPIWVSQTLNYSQLTNPRNKTDCIIPDPRVPTDEGYCSFKNDAEWLSLLHGENKTSGITDDSFPLSSTLVPAVKGFAADIWRELQTIISDWVQKHRIINIMSGPAFDYNSDGLADDKDNLHRLRQNNSILSPSHFFVIITRCHTINMELDKCGDVILSTFILPHLPNTTSCMPVKDFLAKNKARVKDVELITGLQFYTSLNVNERVKLQTSLPKGLWTS